MTFQKGHKLSKGRPKGSKDRTPRVRHCAWCSIRGHEERCCHVKAEGRHWPDAYDLLACELTEGLGMRLADHKRGVIATRLRERALLAPKVANG